MTFTRSGAELSELDLALLRESIRLSEQSRQDGRHPFAALVADAQGQIIASAGNNSMPRRATRPSMPSWSQRRVPPGC